jgi:hypothetical protein
MHHEPVFEMCILKLKSLPAALPSEALAPGAPTWIGCFPTAEGKPANVHTFIKIETPSLLVILSRQRSAKKSHHMGNIISPYVLFLSQILY